VTSHSPLAKPSAVADEAVAAAPASSRRGVTKKTRIGRLLAARAPTLVLLAMCVAIALANPNFLEFRNLVRVANSAAVPLVIALGATFIVLLGSIDLSVEGILSVAATAVALLAANDSNANNWGWLAPLVGVAAGAFLGFANGVVHTYLRIPSFMTTLGVWFIGLGTATVLLGGSAVRLLDSSIRSIALTRFLEFPLAVWISLAMFLVALVIQNLLPFGRHVLAIGGGEDTAELSGIAVRRVRIVAFTLAGCFYGVAGVMAAAQLGQANAVIGDGRLFTAITAVVVGGTALTGGEGGVLHTLVGVLIVAVLANGMVLLGVSPYVQQTVQGLMIIAAVALSLDRQRLNVVK
jgi:ribose transport system permease protein